MGTLRTLAHIEEEYAQTRAALARAKEAIAYQQNDGTLNVSVERERIRALEESLRRLDAEHTRRSGGGIVVRGVVPLDG